MKISLITATYNSEKYLEDTIKSVLSQGYNNLEYIIIDGGSTDRTVSIIKQYKPLFNGCMIWISEKDDGLYDALNKGIKLASGDIVGILNSDDFFTSSNILNQISQTFICNDCEALYADVHFVDPINLNKNIRYYSSSFFRPSLMRMGFMPAHPSFYARRELFYQLGYYKTDYKIAADFELLLRFLYVNKVKSKYIKSDFVTMRIGGLSTESFDSKKQIMREHVRAFRENKIYTNRLILSLRYPYKIWEVLKSKF